ncbi:Calsyntenin-3 [Paragonimus skrjabini miyazakii]|uniref:Calsyntenin-3 n=1 Tax=Paragonimus skrjabini miyazakii TaxID=59628 RepID=A0A8S9ZC57_9TREM|nr:Calsyntenin-3 [Paragonimus skrjabini miyazakii]
MGPLQLVLLIFFGSTRIDAITFVFPNDHIHTYVGYIWKGASKVHLSPQLQAIPNDGDSSQLCGVKVYTTDGRVAPFYTEIVDSKYGLADILMDEMSGFDFYHGNTTIYYLEAYDCSSPPHVSSRVPISIHVVNQDGPFFAQPSYSFTVSQRSYVGTVVGPVQAIQRLRDDEESMTSTICNYSISPIGVPFAIDRYGVIRVGEKLQARNTNRPYMFQVHAEDCHRPTPRTATVDVIVRQITEGCQPGWKGLPTYLEYRGKADKPEKLLRPFKLTFENCVSGCPEPVIQARLEIKSALKGHALKTASPDACLHDPEHLSKQRTLCDIHPGTLTNLLPNPDKEITSQLIGPSLGNPPRLTAPTRAWSFEAASMTTWEVDAKYLDGNEPHHNAFDTDFTVAFWLRRHAKLERANNKNPTDREETVLCSQDQNEPSWRFLSVSLRECHLIVRLMAALRHNTPVAMASETRKPTVWTFGPLPPDYCTSASIIQGEAQWHHYAITFSRNPWGATAEYVSLLIDGQDLGALGVPTETLLPGVPPYIPVEKKARPRVTVGACFDPLTRLAQQYLNAELAGLTLLLDRAESPNNLRCTAQCGESLIVPNVLQYLKSDISVNLESDAVTVSGQNLSHVLDVLQGIAYVRPQQGISPDYTSHVAQARILNLSTLYRCSESEVVSIPHSEIQLNVFPETKPPTHLVEMAQVLDKDSTAGSVWIPSDASTFDRPPISQTIVEQKALANAIKQESSGTPPALIIQGSDIIITEPPIVNPGIRIFSDIQFLLPEETLNNNLRSPADHSAASSVLLDGCQVWISSSGHPTQLTTEPGLRESEEERIEWPVEQVLSLGLFGINDKHGVQLTGRRPSWDYASLLRNFHYWPPKSMRSFETTQTSSNPEADVKYMATVGLMCTIESGQRTTSRFLVKIIIESPDNAEKDLSSNDAIQRLSPEPHSPNMAKSDQERRPLSDKSLRPISQASLSQKTPKSSIGSSRSQAIVAVIVIAVIVIVLAICLILAVYVRRQPHPRTQQQPGRRRRFPLKPADFGGSSLKHDPTLRLTANPIGEMECAGIGTVREDLYGSYKQLASNHPYIFSPPTYRKTDAKSNSSGSARLADLEEFDDDDEEDLNGEDELFNSNPDCSKSELELSGADREADCSTDPTHRSQVLGADVHEWIDEDVHEEEDDEINGLTRGTKQTSVKRDLVSHFKPLKSGPPAVKV